MENPAKFKRNLTICNILNVLATVTLLPAMFMNNQIALMIAFFMSGLFNPPIFGYYFELACEISFPIGLFFLILFKLNMYIIKGEATAGGLMQASYNFNTFMQ
jgi:hypothetical protein